MIIGICGFIGSGKDTIADYLVNLHHFRRESFASTLKDAVAQVIVNQLYKFSELQTSYGINNVTIVKGRPKTLNLKDLISEFVNFRHEIIVRRTEYELREAKKRAHILEGYMKVIGTKDDLDRAIKIIRESSTPELAKDGLIAAFDLSEIQAKAILELRLRTLTGLEIDKIKSEYEELMKLIVYLNTILNSEALRYQIIKDELLEIKKKFGDERKTDIDYSDSEMDMLDLIEEEDVVITVSHLGYIKRTSLAAYRAQKRGGRGAMAGKTREEDYIEHLFVASTHDTLLIFTEKGRCYWLKVYKIPEMDRNAKGRAIQNMLQLPADDKVKTVIDVKDLDNEAYIEQHNIILCTKKGIIKKTSLKEFSRPRSSGVNAITIQEGDELLNVALTNGSSYILIGVKSGRAICFEETKVRNTGRGAIGVFGIELDDENDETIGMICVHKEDKNKQILVVSEKGLGKRTPFFEIDEETKEEVTTYRVTNRGGKGVKTINITEKTGSLVGLLAIEEQEDLMISCKSGITIRMKVSSIREAGRATQGVKLINIEENDQIAAIARIAEQEDEEDDSIENATENPIVDDQSTTDTETTEQNS